MTPALAALVCIGLAACAAPVTHDDPSPSSSVTPATGIPRSAQSGEPVPETPIRIAVGDRVLAARLWDNPAARSLIEQLPVTVPLEDYGRQEVSGTPPRALTMDGMPSGDDPEIGDIGYYAPTGVVVLYYADVTYFPGIARIGRIDGDLSAIKGWNGSVSVTIERAG